jgi:DMSO/TMAO reductase YedYZ molybdopterin-dependent catalytic subunit
MTDACDPISVEPFVRPTPPPALERPSLPTELHFRRDHFRAPEVDAASWRLRIGGAVRTPVELTLDELQALPHRALDAVLECAGHRRAELVPAVPGVAWALGALSEARWGGVGLADVLALAGAQPRATATVLVGADRGSFGADPTIVPFARALPLAKALHPDTLLAWEMNGAPLPAGHGAPLRAIVPGWYATDSVKWLESIELIEGTFDGPFEARDYRLPDPETGTTHRMSTMPVHAIVTSPTGDAAIAAGALEVRGVAWGGEGGIALVEVSVDGGDWVAARLTQPAGPYGLARWSRRTTLAAGRHELAVRATDGAGTTQPEAPTWNPGGYANASVHRVCVAVGKALPGSR